MKRKEKILIFSTMIIMVVGICTGLFYAYKNKDLKPSQEESQAQTSNTSFDYDMLKEANKNYKNSNYLISPYSMKIAISMVRDGANGDTRSQIEKMIGNDNIELLNSKERISTANSLFVKDEYKDRISDSYYDNIKNKYDGEIIYDNFLSPDAMNKWIYEKTYEMIKDPIKQVDPKMVIGIINALAIDVEWEQQFECSNTYSVEFRKSNGEKFETEMMHNTYNQKVKYFKTSDESGVILPYRAYDEEGKEDDNGISLEFIGILPNGDLNNYIENFNEKILSKIDNNAKEPTDKKELNLALPRFEYEFNFGSFKDSLINLGMKDAFLPGYADFSNIAEESELYISDAIHDTYIKLGETGTKAAAVTAFIFKDNAVMEEKKKVNITFDKPFMYIIRDKKSKNILFIGTVYEPNKWEGSTCEKTE